MVKKNQNRQKPGWPAQEMDISIFSFLAVLFSGWGITRPSIVRFSASRDLSIIALANHHILLGISPDPTKMSFLCSHMYVHLMQRTRSCCPPLQVGVRACTCTCTTLRKKRLFVLKIVGFSYQALSGGSNFVCVSCFEGMRLVDRA